MRVVWNFDIDTANGFLALLIPVESNEQRVIREQLPIVLDNLFKGSYPDAVITELNVEILSGRVKYKIEVNDYNGNL